MIRTTIYLYFVKNSKILLCGWSKYDWNDIHALYPWWWKMANLWPKLRNWAGKSLKSTPAGVWSIEKLAVCFNKIIIRGSRLRTCWLLSDNRTAASSAHTLIQLLSQPSSCLKSCLVSVTIPHLWSWRSFTDGAPRDACMATSSRRSSSWCMHAYSSRRCPP